MSFRDTGWDHNQGEDMGDSARDREGDQGKQLKFIKAPEDGVDAGALRAELRAPLIRLLVERHQDHPKDAAYPGVVSGVGTAGGQERQALFDPLGEAAKDGSEVCPRMDVQEGYVALPLTGPPASDVVARRLEARRLLVRFLAQYALARHEDSADASKAA